MNCSIAKKFQFFIISLMLWASLLSSHATYDPTFTLIGDMRLPGATSVQGWANYDVSYMAMVEVYTNLTVLGQRAGIDCPVSAPAGAYKVWLGIATQGTNCSVEITGGDGSVTNTAIATTDIQSVGTLVSTIPITNLQLTVTRIRNSTSQNYWFGAIGLSDTNYDYISGTTRMVDFSPIITTNSTAVKGNYLPNSSFEFGMDGGWTGGKSAQVGVEPWYVNMVTNAGYHGTYSVVIANDKIASSPYNLFSPTINLRGDRNWRNYTLSFYYRANATFTATTSWGLNYTNDLDGVANFETSTSWTRFSTNLWLRPFPNRVFQFQIRHVNATGRLQIDGVQFEEGGLTAYSPTDAVESSMKINRNGNVFDVGDARNIIIELYNSTAYSSNVVFNYMVYDWKNQLMTSNAVAYTATAGYSENTLTLATTNLGTSRVQGWLQNSPNTTPELVFSVVNIPNTLNVNTNSHFGIHNNVDESAYSNNLWGIAWNRSLSPAGFIEWEQIEASTNVFTWTTTDEKLNAWTNRTIPFVNLSDVADIPTWALTNSFPRVDAWSNFVWKVVNRYKDRVQFWEDINEPSSYNATAYADLLTQTVGAVKAADPSAYFVAFGGLAEGSGTIWGSNVWTALGATAKSQIDAVSVHQYNYIETWNTVLDDTDIDNDVAFGVYCDNKPVWNTETGAWTIGDFRGRRHGGPIGAISYARHNEEYIFRNIQKVERQSQNWFRSLGRGMPKYFYYDARLIGQNGWVTATTAPTFWNFDDSFNSMGVAYLWSAYFLEGFTSAVATSNSVNNVMAFVFNAPNSGSNTLVTWSLNRSNYIATVTNGGFGVYDLHGNQLVTNSTSIPISRRPTYWVSPTLTSIQLSNIFKYATITGLVDTNAPNVSIDDTPHGNVDGKQLPLRFRWSAIDNFRVNTDDNPKVVKTRYRIPGVSNTWSDWSEVRYIELNSIPSTSAYLEVQARDEDLNTSTSMYGPTFGPSFIPAKPIVNPSIATTVKAMVRWSDTGAYKVTNSTIIIDDSGNTIGVKTQSIATLIISNKIYFTNGMVFLQQNSAPVASDIGGTVGSVTNHLIRNVLGNLYDYYSDGTTLWTTQLAP